MGWFLIIKMMYYNQKKDFPKKVVKIKIKVTLILINKENNNFNLINNNNKVKIKIAKNKLILLNKIIYQNNHNLNKLIQNLKYLKNRIII